MMKIVMLGESFAVQSQKVKGDQLLGVTLYCRS